MPVRFYSTGEDRFVAVSGFGQTRGRFELDDNEEKVVSVALRLEGRRMVRFKR